MIRTINVILVLAMVGLSVLLYAINYQADSAERAGEALKKQIAHEQETIRVLRAEWSYLNQPDRLQELSEKYLDLQPAIARQIGTFESIPQKPAPNLSASPASASPSQPDVRGAAMRDGAPVQIAKAVR